MKLKIGILLLLGLIQQASAQNHLSLQEAINLTLQNNYDIKLAKNNVQIAKNNLIAGKWQFAPTLNSNLNLGGAIQNAKLLPATGAERVINGAENYNMSYGLNLGWTIFDGFQMYANYNKLKELEKLGDVTSKATILNNIAEVIMAYYHLSMQQKLIRKSDSILNVSKFRLQIANTKFELGRGSKLDVLAAQVDYNTDTSMVINQKNTTKLAMIALNKLLARNQEIEFTVDENFSLDKNFNFTEISEKAKQLNPDLQTTMIKMQLAHLNLKQVKGQRYPLVNLNSGYAYTQATTPTGFNQKTRTNSINYGLTMSIPIFNGFAIRQQERNATVEIKSAELNIAKTKDEIQSSLLNMYQNYQTYVQLLALETKNVEIAKQNLAITLEKYTLGNIPALTLREAQNNALTAEKRLIEVMYQAKSSEITLKQISGTLKLE